VAYCCPQSAGRRRQSSPHRPSTATSHLEDSSPLLFNHQVWAGLADGTVTVAFRRWKRPSVKAGGTLQSPGGLLAIDEIAPITLDDVNDADARAAGYADRDSLLAGLRPDGQLYRVRFHRVGDDPRIELRQRTDFDDAELSELMRVVARLPWAGPILRLIADNPGVVSTDLAPQVRLDRARFKQRVRRLKALGLTESLDIGYRLSPRGAALLRRLPDGPDQPAARAATSRLRAVRSARPRTGTGPPEQ
jgi:hypothetical protein